MELRFLGRDHFPLSSASSIILEELATGSDDGPFDLRHLTIALSGSRAGRLLLRALVDTASRTGRGLLPPVIVTPGRLPDLLLDLEGTIASPMATIAAMVESLRSCREDVVEELLPPGAQAGVAALLPTARLLTSTRLALASAGIGFEKAALIASSFDMAAARRLHCAEAVDRKYREILTRSDLVDRDDAIASALARGVSHEGPIVLLSMTEIPLRLQNILESCADVRALVHAREKDRNRYDRFGQPIPEIWEEVATLPLEGRLLTSGTPAGLARAIIEAIVSHPQARSIEETAIGVADSDLAPWLLETFRRCHLLLHDPAGSSFQESAPGGLLEALSGTSGASNPETLATLVRHPDIHRRLTREAREEDPSDSPQDPIVAIDRWRSTRHPRSETDIKAPAVVEKLTAALSPLEETPGSLGGWSEPLGRTFCNLVGDALIPEQNWGALIGALEEMSLLPDSLAPTASAADAIATLSDALAQKQLPHEHSGPAMEMLGWLELELDDSPLVVVTGIAEGKIAATESSDALLSEGLKKELGLAGSGQRSARDAHILDTILDSPRNAILGLSSTDGDGTPLLPSRLLLKGDEAAEILRDFLGASSPRRETPLLDAATPATPADLGFPTPGTDLEGLKKISVTAFGDWLTCPVLFWLRRVWKIEPLHDRDLELDGLAFGNLLHDTLDEFGKDPLQRDLIEEAEISAALEAQLEKVVSRDLASRRQAAVSVQIEQARARLRRFASEQSELRRQGWRIIASEIKLDPDRCQLETEAGALSISGRIDRIDFHEESGEIRILDYKTGDTPRSPNQVHLKGKRGNRQWASLQLPLYSHFASLIRGEGIPEPFPEEVQTGYLLLPRDGNAGALSLSSWNTHEEEEAIDLARQEGARILRGEVGPAQVISGSFQRAFAGVTIDPESLIVSADEEEAQ